MWVFSFVYGLCQVLLTYNVLPHQPNLIKVFYCRVGCICCQVVILVMAIVTNYLMRDGMKDDYPTHITAGVPAYTENIVLNCTEWLAISLILFFLSTFYVEFRNVELTLGVLTLLPDNGDGDEQCEDEENSHVSDHKESFKLLE